MRVILLLTLTLLLGGCTGYSRVLEQTPPDKLLAAAKVYKVAPVSFTWTPPANWEVTGEEWEKERKTLSDAFRQEVKEESRKQVDILKLDDKPTEGVRVDCNVFAADCGGWGSSGTIAAEVTLTDIKSGRVLYKGKLEGNSRNAGMEGKDSWGRFRVGLQNIAREVAEIMDDAG